MVKQILDLHIHSKYSRACSKSIELESIAQTCEEKGINIVSTGDFTHPLWYKHIKDSLIETYKGSGIYKLKNNKSKTKFILGTEIACIKKHKGVCRRLHLCIFAPSIESVFKLNSELEKAGFNIRSDGRPILGMTAKDLLIFIKKIDKNMQMIPAHVWTPWFGLFGSKSGYDSLEECFEELSSEIFALETGLSTDPYMNWKWSKLDKYTLVSNSDAHSLKKLGREANVLNFKNEKEINLKNIFEIIKNKNKDEFLYTIEFYPEEGKYHYDGHRDCNFVCDPKEAKKYKGICPVCKKKLTLGVCNRIEKLSDRNEKQIKEQIKKNIPYKSLVPLQEILSDVFEKGVNTKTVQNEYNNLIKKIGNEFFILLEADLEKYVGVVDKRILDAINRVRKGDIYIKPGYDGEFGVVKVFDDKKRKNKNLKIEF